MILELRNVSKSFGGLKAVSNISLAIPEGHITALIGPNGAGKTTLFGLIAGFDTPDHGRIHFEERDITGMAPHRIALLGLVRTFQIAQPFARLSLRENIAVGAHLRIGSRAEAFRRAAEVARRVGLGDRLDQPAESLTVAGRKRLELARALATEPRLLLLDEVMAGLNPREIEEIVDIILNIRNDGVTILLTEHVMRAVMRLSDHAFVLNDGMLIAEGEPERIAADPRVIEAYLGSGAAQRVSREAPRA